LAGKQQIPLKSPFFDPNGKLAQKNGVFNLCQHFEISYSRNDKNIYYYRCLFNN